MPGRAKATEIRITSGPISAPRSYSKIHFFQIDVCVIGLKKKMVKSNSYRKNKDYIIHGSSTHRISQTPFNKNKIVLFSALIQFLRASKEST